MNAIALIRWASLEERRRRQHSEGLRSLPRVILSVFLGSILAAEIARRILMSPPSELSGTLASASRLWLAVAISGFLVGVFGAPFRLFWRRDSKLLASLPVPGASLFALALWRSQQVALHTTIALICGLVTLGALGDWSLTARHLLPLAIGFAGSAWLGPAAALAAGAFIASDKAQAVVASMGGEFQAPRTTWLSVFPGVAATAVAIGIIACGSWLLGGRAPGGSIALVAALGFGAPILALAWAWSQADRVVPAAVREVAALDQEILAHVDRSTPSMLERLYVGLRLGAVHSQTLALKDASLSRRRYPSPYFLLPCGLVALWIVAATQPGAYLAWGGSLLLTLLAYALLMARRAFVKPIEIPAFLRTLAISPKGVLAAKRALAELRIASILALGAAPLVLRSADMVGTGVFVLVAGALALLASRLLSLGD